MRNIKTSELKGIIEASNFSIIETNTLYNSPPNYYIAAQKK